AFHTKTIWAAAGRIEFNMTNPSLRIAHLKNIDLATVGIGKRNDLTIPRLRKAGKAVRDHQRGMDRRICQCGTGNEVADVEKRAACAGELERDVGGCGGAQHSGTKQRKNSQSALARFHDSPQLDGIAER